MRSHRANSISSVARQSGAADGSYFLRSAESIKRRDLPVAIAPVFGHIGAACGESRASGCSSGVEHNLAKVGVEGSNPFARSNFFNKTIALAVITKRSPARLHFIYATISEIPKVSYDFSILYRELHRIYATIVLIFPIAVVSWWYLGSPTSEYKDRVLISAES